MKTHQKYFAVVDDAGKLLNHFVTVSNTGRGTWRWWRGATSGCCGPAWPTPLLLRRGPEEDPRAHAEGLKKVVFQSKLGTSHEKMERFRALAAKIAAADLLRPAPPWTASPVLCKADLVTLMVGEFPELQGVVGREYAPRAGEDPVVARGIEEHYWPVQAGGPLPSDPEAQAVGVADKLDTIVGCFGVGLIPTGTADPYALRRQTLGVLRILDEKGYRLPLGWLVDQALEELGAKLTRDAAEVRRDVLSFFRGRLEGLFAQAGLSGDLVAAALDAGFDDPVDARARVRTLEEARRSGELAPLAETFKRVANILKGQETGTPAPERFEVDAERDLWRVYEAVRGAMESAAARGAYGDFLATAAQLKAAVDAFFDAVLVMADDPAVRANRLALLGSVAALFRTVADFARVG